MTSHGELHNSTGPNSSHDDVKTTAGFKVYGTIFKTDSRYEFLNPLGKGSYGIVCAARDRETGQRLAIKKVSPMAKRSVDARHTLREMLLLQLLGNHPNVVSIHNLSTNLRDDELYIVMDLMDTDMHRVIQSSQTLSESHIKYFLHQLLRGVKYLHDNGVLHRDLKPGNLLLTKTCQLKIADFGLARKTPRHTGSTTNGLMPLSERPRSAPASSASSTSRAQVDHAPMTEHVVTRWYRAPELMLQPDGFYDESVDMWSVGCIFAEILGRKALFPGKNFLHQLTLIFDIIGTPPQETTAKIKSSQAQRFLKSLGKKPKVPFRTVFPSASEEALDLLERLLEFDPERRISAKEALAHPYMQPIEKKYKGIDPPPSTRVDFSFDTKKLTKMDLRALIIKEVEVFRRSVAHTEALDADTGSDFQSSETTTPSNMRLSGESAGKLRPASAPAFTMSTTTKSGVMCGLAEMSMGHSSIRQRPANDECGANEEDPAGRSLQRPSTTNSSYPNAAIGSNRQRIRRSTKPPVPKQTVGTSGEVQRADRVAIAQQSTANRLVSSQKISNDQMRGRPAAPVAVALHDEADSPHEVCISQPQVLAHLNGLHSNRPTLTDGNATCSVGSTIAISRTTQRVLKINSTIESSHAPSESLIEGVTADNVDPAGPELSRASLSPKSPTPPSNLPGEGRQETNPQSRAITDEALSLGCARGVDRSTQLEPPRRRNASAGSIRRKPIPCTAHAQSLTGSSGHGQTAFVGSTTSLIRAQRFNKGQSLADSANEVIAAIARKRDINHSHESRRGPEDREEVDTGSAALRPQRSMTQLNQVEAGGRKLGRKLTVPKSPKFSVMSWQKKRETRGERGTGGPCEGYVLPRR